ncbi:MAG TPA: DUF2147 domain-containing protein [Allosphingosinicella sp.]|nr:DUF2147 domain-containing protein [Allosphingosinicella sp.]
MRRAPTFALLGLWSAAAAAAAPVEGLWLTDDRKGVVRIGPCGRQMCGWVARVIDRGPGVPTRDVRNPDPRLRGRPILGLPTLTGFSGAGGEWTGGRAYDPKSGRSYRASLSLQRDGALNVTGCVLFICQTKRWTRTR